MKQSDMEESLNLQTLAREEAGSIIEMYRKRNTPIDVQYCGNQVIILIHSNQLPHPRTPWALVNHRLAYSANGIERHE
ncbi:hypothetical protein [Photobacterium nomapromontoriensis]|uniref:hypothetical protein n=1 Tax=Photobacterium nomapromontoriensis TaxID=2910237 RepID=UPI003D0BF5AC